MAWVCGAGGIDPCCRGVPHAQLKQQHLLPFFYVPVNAILLLPPGSSAFLPAEHSQLLLLFMTAVAKTVIPYMGKVLNGLGSPSTALFHLTLP